MKSLTGMALAAVLAAGTCASAAEFQPLGAVGMGGAGVARMTNAYATYWNPAALAFGETTTSFRISGGVGAHISNDLAQSVDQLNTLGDPTFDFGADQSVNSASAARAAEVVGLLENMNHRDESVVVTSSSAMAFQYRRLGVGIFGNVEMMSRPKPDLGNIRPDTGIPVDAAGFGLAIGATPVVGTPAPQFFTPQQIAQIAGAFGNGPTGLAIAYRMDQQYASNGSTVDPATAATGLAAIGTGLATGDTLANNQSRLVSRGLGYAEAAIGYGHPLDFGTFGKLAVGISGKYMLGRVYISQPIIFNRDSGDIMNDVTKDYRQSGTWGVDVGALYRYGETLSIGVVAKNLNTPKFREPLVQLKDAQGTPTGEQVGGGWVKVEPQVRAGFAWSPLSWLTVAADADLTRNATIQPGIYSRNVGGGLEVHPWTWLKLRGGAYKNLEGSESGIVPTAGFTIGTKWVNVDLDAAVSPKTANYDGHKYPEEAKVDFNLNIQF